ncbi:MAG: PH domain-containing protein [Actinomycetota bacterium]
MSFPERNLNEGEEIALDLKPHWWVFALPGGSLLGLLVLLILVWVAFDQVALNVVVGIGIVAVVGWIAVRYAQWTTTAFVVTNRRLIYRSGVVSKEGIEIPLDRVNNVIFRQTLFERVLGAGDLMIESAGESGQQHFENVRKPNAVQNEIYHQMEELERDRLHPQAAAPAPAEESIPDQIAQLARLRDEGVLTQDEFEAKKRDLLGRM